MVDTPANAVSSSTQNIAARAHAAHSATGNPAASPPHSGNAWFLALTALGIVYGDIGTSPLYTFSVALNATGHAAPTATDVLGSSRLPSGR